MESQMVRPRDYAQEQDPNTVQGGEEQRGKKSVLKKVKAKAKKIKNSIIPKPGDGENNGHDDSDQVYDRNVPDDHDLDEEDDDDQDYSEESSEGPEVHGAPIYESEKAVMSGREEEDIPLSSFSESSPKESNTFVPGSESNKVNLERPGGLEEDPHAPAARDQNPSNYLTKVSDPSGNGAGEVRESPIVSSFGKMSIEEDSSQPKSNQSVYSSIGTGSHDQFSPQPTTTPVSTPTSGYVSSATSALASRAVSAKNMVASKLGYGEKDNTAPESPPTNTAGETKPATSALADKAISTKNMVASKLGYGEKDDTAPENVSIDTANESKPAASALADKAISTKNTVASKLGYGEKDETAPHSESPGTGTTGEGKSTRAVITDRAISAKNTVASKLGYGEKDNTTPETTSDTTPNTSATADENKPASATATATDYGKKIASTVYGSVAGAGTAVMSKIPRGSGTGSPESESPVKETAAKAEDKGVSVKEYLAEKLRPGEDDTALSDAITDAIHKRQPEEEETPRKKSPESGKVMQSEEVTRRLGDDGESETRIEGKGSGYVDKVKGTVTSWLGYGDQSSKGSPKSSAGEKVDDDGLQGKDGKDEVNLQESSKY